MILVLGATTSKITAKMDGSGTSSEFVATYADATSTAFAEGASGGAMNGTLDVDIVAAPASSTQRIIKTLAFTNQEGSSRTITVEYDFNGTKRTICKQLLADFETLVIDENGISVAGASTTTQVGAHIFEARLTLESGVPISTSDQTAKTNIYLTPYNGNRVRVFNGTRWVVYTLTEKTLAIGMLASATIPNDIFLYDNAGTLTLEKLAWTNGTTRATGLTTQDGVYVKSGDTTRLYVGTFYPTAVTTTEDSNAKRFVWNMYNRARRELRVSDSTSSWNYTIATYRQARATATNQVEVVVGLAEVLVDLLASHACYNGTANVKVTTGIGVNSTSANSADVNCAGNTQVVNYETTMWAALKHMPAAGYTYYAWLEQSAATGTTTWYGQNGNWINGMTGSTEA